MEQLPRERVLRALAHQKADRIPLDFWATSEVWDKMKAHFQTQDVETILENLGIDIREVQPDYIGPEFRKESDGSYFDSMGVHRRVVHNAFCAYDEYASAPLGYVKELADFEAYRYWPKVEHYNFKNLAAKVGGMHDKYYIKLETGGLFEYAWALRGYEQFMMDIVLEPEIAHFIMEKLTVFWCDYIELAMSSAGDQYDMVYTYDDIASQNSLLLSKGMWAEFIKPYHERLNKIIRKFGKTIMYHSCGAVFELIGDLADLPIDVLNPIQPRASGMDFQRIKDNFGGKLCFHGGIDIQYVLPRGSVEEVKQAVRHAIDTLGANGGYILTSAHHIQADTPVENIIQMYEEAKAYSAGKSKK